MEDVYYLYFVCVCERTDWALNLFSCAKNKMDGFVEETPVDSTTTTVVFERRR
jgi:hypothetical protein